MYLWIVIGTKIRKIHILKKICAFVTV